MAHYLLRLPDEVLHSILAYVDPEDITALRCCHNLDDFIRNNSLLFKEIYLRHYVGGPYHVWMNGNNSLSVRTFRMTKPK